LNELIGRNGIEIAMNPYQFRISLWLRHPTMGLSFASAKFDLKPRREWVSGTPRVTMTGAALDGTYDASYWSAPLLGGEIRDSRNQTLDEALSEVLEALSSQSRFLNDFRSEGGSIDLNVGIFSPKDEHFGIELPPELLGASAALSVQIGLSVYPGDPHE
jgi:hypothetical protein